MTTRIWTDPIVDEIHHIRQEIAKEAGNDLHTLVRGFKSLKSGTVIGL